MDQVSKMQTAGLKDFINKNHLGVDQCPTGDENQGHQKIKHCRIRDFLQRIKLAPAVDRKGCFLAFKNAEQVIIRLAGYLFLQVPPS